MEEDIKILEEEIKRVHKINDLSGTYVPIHILENLINGYRKKDKIINKMAEQLTSPIHSKDWVIEYYTNEVNKEV